MNKLVKLPLFLGTVGVSCGIILAGVNVATAGTIAKNKEKIPFNLINLNFKSSESIERKNLDWPSG